MLSVKLNSLLPPDYHHELPIKATVVRTLQEKRVELDYLVALEAMMSRMNSFRLRAQAITLMVLAVGADYAHADIFPLVPSDDVVGQIEYILTQRDDTLVDISRNLDLGYNEIRDANPQVNAWLPGVNTKVLIPKSFILPNVEKKGLVLNLAEMRVYYYDYADTTHPVIRTHPVGIGRYDWKTPLGSTKVVEKVVNPAWRPPATIRAEHAADGDPLPAVVPPGPDNPLGRFAFRLGIPGYLIHGTNKPYGAGMQVSHGCVRMNPEDIEALFPLVPVGTPVTIVNEPVKVGWRGEQLYLEVHNPLEGELRTDDTTVDKVLRLVERVAADRPVALDGEAIRRTIDERLGIPVLINVGNSTSAGSFTTTTETSP